MRVRELIEQLRYFDQDAEVKGVFQPSYPLVGDILGAVLDDGDDRVDPHNYEWPEPDEAKPMNDACAVCGDEIDADQHAPNAKSVRVILAVGDGFEYGKRDWYEDL